METKDVILSLRNKNNLSQEELAEKVFVTRQAVSRWETGETIPNTETLKQLSKLFDVSINTLLELRDSLFANAAECLLTMKHLAKNPMANSMKITVNGVTVMVNSHTEAKNSLLIFV